MDSVDFFSSIIHLHVQKLSYTFTYECIATKINYVRFKSRLEIERENLVELISE